MDKNQKCILLAAFGGFMLATGIFEILIEWPLWRVMVSIILGLSGIIAAMKEIKQKK